MKYISTHRIHTTSLFELGNVENIVTRKLRGKVEPYNQRNRDKTHPYLFTEIDSSIINQSNSHNGKIRSNTPLSKPRILSSSPTRSERSQSGNTGHKSLIQN